MITAVTGNIAAGKSSAVNVMRELGCEVIDADEIYHELTAKGGALCRAIAGEWGDGVLSSDGSVDRRALSSVVLQSPERLARLNAITHPEIIAEIRRRISESCSDEVVLEIPLLFESGCAGMADRIWLVDADRDVRMRRLMARNSLTEEEALRRMSLQREVDPGLCDAVILNNGTVDDLRAAVSALLLGDGKNDGKG